LGNLGLVGKDTDARVKAHRLKRDDVEVVHLDQLSRAFLIERTRENASSRRVEAA
jgi:RecB family endonuclease NucS